MSKLGEVLHEMLVFLHPRVSSRVSGFPVASPCLWGKLRTPHSTFYTLDSALHTLHFTLHTLHFALYTPHSRLYTPHSTLYTPHSSLYTGSNQSLGQIPGSCMKQALFVLAMKMAVSSQITMEKRSSLSENGHFCYPLKELL